MASSGAVKPCGQRLGSKSGVCDPFISPRVQDLPAAPDRAFLATLHDNFLLPDLSQIAFICSIREHRGVEYPARIVPVRLLPQETFIQDAIGPCKANPVCHIPVLCARITLGNRSEFRDCRCDPCSQELSTQNVKAEYHIPLPVRLKL